jgi:hypothetical protein
LQTFDLLLNALAIPGATFVLGAGASAPNVPTLGQLPVVLAPFASQLSSFPAGRIADSPLRDLIAPLIARARVTTTLGEWKSGAMTSATIAVLIEYLIDLAHRRPLPQYAVFALFPYNSSVVSFNWDGLAAARCPQATVIHPHGTVRPRGLLPVDLDRLLDFSQMNESLGFRAWLIPGLVMPGEETADHLHSVRERVLDLWLTAPAAIVIGYSFGMGHTADYDRVWREIFVEAMSRNSSAPIHILAPDADVIQGEFAEEIGRSVNIYSWGIRWDLFSRVLLETAHNQGATSISALRPHGAAIVKAYLKLAHT